MIQWYEIFLLLIILSVILWWVRRYYLPTRRLVRMIQRLSEGQPVHAWEVSGPQMIRGAARSLEVLSDDFIQLRRSKHTAEAELDSVLANIEEGVVIVGVDGLIKLANQSIHRLFSLNQKIVGLPLRDQVPVFEVNDVVQHALSTGKEQGDFISYTLALDGLLQKKSYRLSGTPLKDGKQQVLGCLLVVADFSKIKEMESVERQMVASVSHELRTPLAIFKGYLELLIDLEQKGNPETRRVLEVLMRQSNRLNQLVEDLLILSRVEERGLGPIRESVKVSDFLERVREESRQVLDPETEIECKIEAGVDEVEMDAFRMEQAFHNLIDNAQRHSDGAKTIEIGVKRNSSSNEYHFYVQDHGVGIPSDKLPMIFNRFYRVDRARSRERGGTGLGLAIVREIMRAHGGDAWAESDIGEGTTMWLSLPVNPKEIEE